MVDQFQEIEDTKPRWRVVEEAVAVGSYVPCAYVIHPERLDVNRVVGGEVESCGELVFGVIDKACSCHHGESKVTFTSESGKRSS